MNESKGDAKMRLFKPNVEKMRKKKDIEGLAKALRYTKDPSLQENAAEVLREIGNAKAIKALINVSADNDPTAQKICRDTLSKMDAPTVNLALARQAFEASKDDPNKWKMLRDFLTERVGADEAVEMVKQANIEHIITSIKELMSDLGITFGRVVMAKRDGTDTGDLVNRWDNTLGQVVAIVNKLLQMDEDYIKDAAVEGVIQGLIACVQWQHEKERARQFFTELVVKNIPQLKMSTAELQERCGWSSSPKSI